jgi:hypothetical protein
MLINTINIYLYLTIVTKTKQFFQKLDDGLLFVTKYYQNIYFNSYLNFKD